MLSLRFKPKLNALCRAFSKIHLEPSREVVSCLFIKADSGKLVDNKVSKILFTPRSIIQNIMPVYPMVPSKEILDIPTINKVIELPYSSKINEIIDGYRYTNEIVEPPANTEKPGIQAARLIIIRRKKMKKHKLKKLRKKMKFEWAKVRQRREMRKEKAFQADLIGQIKEAEKFSAEKYVSDKIAQATEVPIPRFWKGKRLPQFIIKQKLGIK